MVSAADCVYLMSMSNDETKLAAVCMSGDIQIRHLPSLKVE